MNTHSLLILLLLLQCKHLIVDWCWQPAYEWQNKGSYGHFGGIRHAAKNAIGTAMCFVPFASWSVVFLVLIIDGVLHYHIDWCKMNINQKMGWSANTHAQFWWLTGADQFLHQIAYIFLIFCVA